MAASSLGADDAKSFSKSLQPFFEQHCYECHDDLSTKGGLDLTALPTDLSDEANLVDWIRIYDRVAAGEMPPKEEPRPGEDQITAFRNSLAPLLADAHQPQKGTVLRRLNRNEYQNTLNDLFGIHLDVKSTLPEDARSHEFDNIGESLSISEVQMQRYLNAAKKILETAIADRTAPPVSKVIKASYGDTRDAAKFIGTSWHQLPDKAVVFYRNISYPTGLLREAHVRTSGYYKIRVTGYAHQSDSPIVFSVGGMTYKRGVDLPTYGYYAFHPGKPQTIELTAWMEENFMVITTPQGLYDETNSIKNDGIANYKGPGLAIQHIELEGPIVDQFPGRGHELIFEGLERKEIEPGNPNDKTKSWYKPKFEIVSANPSEDVARALTRVSEKAFRRPVKEEELAPYLALFESEMANEATFEVAYRTALQAILCSPDFLYLREKPGALDDYALASRLSYFLNRTLPDKELLADAAARKLSGNGEALKGHALRLLQNEKSERFIEDFTDAWLDLRNIEFTTPDSQLYPEFDPYLQDSMISETRMFFRELISSNLPVTDVVKSDFVMVNDRLASHYGIEGNFGPTVKKAAFPPDTPRGGFLTQASVLKVSANGTNTSPVLRGVFVNERILGKHPAPPPPGIPGVEPDIRGTETLRETLAKHRNSENCNSCHTMIDPPGFALESFDPVGSWRDKFRSLGEGERIDKVVNGRKVRYKIGLPVDASGELESGETFSGFLEFQELLASNPDTLAKALITKFLTFGTGREMGFSDRPEINQIVSMTSADNHRIRDLILEVVTSEIFRHK